MHLHPRDIDNFLHYLIRIVHLQSDNITYCRKWIYSRVRAYCWIQTYVMLASFVKNCSYFMSSREIERIFLLKFWLQKFESLTLSVASFAFCNYIVSSWGGSVWLTNEVAWCAAIDDLLTSIYTWHLEAGWCAIWSDLLTPLSTCCRIERFFLGHI